MAITVCQTVSGCGGSQLFFQCLNPGSIAVSVQFLETAVGIPQDIPGAGQAIPGLGRVPVPHAFFQQVPCTYGVGEGFFIQVFPTDIGDILAEAHQAGINPPQHIQICLAVILCQQVFQFLGTTQGMGVSQVQTVGSTGYSTDLGYCHMGIEPHPQLISRIGILRGILLALQGSFAIFLCPLQTVFILAEAINFR